MSTLARLKQLRDRIDRDGGDSRDLWVLLNVLIDEREQPSPDPRDKPMKNVKGKMTVAEARELLAMGRKLQDAFLPRVQAMQGLPDPRDARIAACRESRDLWRLKCEEAVVERDEWKARATDAVEGRDKLRDMWSEEKTLAEQRAIDLRILQTTCDAWKARAEKAEKERDEKYEAMCRERDDVIKTSMQRTDEWNKQRDSLRAEVERLTNLAENRQTFEQERDEARLEAERWLAAASELRADLAKQVQMTADVRKQLADAELELERCRVVAEEREACAKECEDVAREARAREPQHFCDPNIAKCAARIRARGKG